MADYTYAASTKKVYDEAVQEEQRRADAWAKTYAEKEQAANKTWSDAIRGIYANQVKAQEETAAADTKKAYASYDTQFDANAASEFAQRRALKEQMANYGLGTSGFNATNQTALAVARQNADAATRAARQQAVDTIAENLRQYKANSANELAGKLADGERESAERVLENEQTLQQRVHENAVDVLGANTDRVELDLKQEELDNELLLKQEELNNEKAQQTQLLKNYVDNHNQYIYQNMLSAYNQGNVALAEEYAKQLWQLNEDGTVSVLPFDTKNASTHVKTEAQRQETAKRTENEEDKTIDAVCATFGFPKKYGKYIEEARKCVQGMAQTSSQRIRETLTSQAMNMLLLIDQQSKSETGSGYMDEETFKKLLRYVGVDYSEYALFKGLAAMY